MAAHLTRFPPSSLLSVGVGTDLNAAYETKSSVLSFGSAQCPGGPGTACAQSFLVWIKQMTLQGYVVVRRSRSGGYSHVL